ncbi:MAG: GTPase ObgE [Bacteroidetes bacterium]|nr:GTPase ObgE [Bacteroidota bacterium]
MAENNFIDYVKICCRSGAGGKGLTHFHRDKLTAKGGPDGGDGGRGGHIILRGDKQQWTLLHLKYRKHIIAGDGVNGGSSNKSGAYGLDDYLPVPLGTVARDAETGKILFEITKEGEEKILTPGGRGGLGNQHFKSAARQNPQHSQPGEPGLEQWVVLELKVLADVGLVGFPNAGKSTLLSVISEAKPKIADYAFTTLVPNLGVVAYRDFKSFIMADIPGIIEGAHEGRGLGLRFLRHIERNSILLFLIPADADDIAKEYAILLNEIEQFNPQLALKQRILAISKSDLIDAEIKADVLKKLPDIPCVFISSLTGLGIQEMKDLLWETMNRQ